MSTKQLHDDDYEALRDAPVEPHDAVRLRPCDDGQIGFRVDFLGERVDAIQAAANEWGVRFQEAAHRLVDEALATRRQPATKR